MPLEELQRGLTRIIETAPSLPEKGPIPADYMQWAADANAMIVATGYFSLAPEAQVAINGLSFANRATKREQLMMILHKARSQIELEMRQSGKGLPTSPTGPLRPETNPANWPPLSQPTARPTARLEDLISPYFTKDPRTSGMDPRTSHMGFRPQPDGNVPAPIRGAQATAVAGQISIPRTTEAKLEELATRVALLEAAISLPKPPGVGHNRGPNLENEETEEEEIRLFIARLGAEPEKIDSATLQDLAVKETERAENGLKLHVEVAKGLAKGAGSFVGKKLAEEVAQSAWWMNVYERLKDVAKAIFELLGP
ncbi:hypothetical protein ACO2JO_04045 [Leptospira interrogans]